MNAQILTETQETAKSMSLAQLCRTRNQLLCREQAGALVGRPGCGSQMVPVLNHIIEEIAAKYAKHNITMWTSYDETMEAGSRN